LKRRTVWLLLALSALLLVAGGVAGAPLFVPDVQYTFHAGTGPTAAGPARIEPTGPVPDVPTDPANPDSAVDAILLRRTRAVLTQDRELFLADLDSSDPEFVRRQERVFDNLTSLPFGEFAFRRQDGSYPQLARESGLPRAYAPRVTIEYAFEGFDQGTIAAPWVPLFAWRGNRWVIAGEASGDQLPDGTGAQVWDVSPILALSSEDVLLIVSEGQANTRALLDRAQQATETVQEFRQDGWSGRVVMIAVDDTLVYNSFWGRNETPPADVAAIAVEMFDGVWEWSDPVTLTETGYRIILNPDAFREVSRASSLLLVHEITHVALGPISTFTTPVWIAEGIAEYVALEEEPVEEWIWPVRQAIEDGRLPSRLPDGQRFYDEPDINYTIGWLACRYIASEYGEPTLLDYYERLGTEHVNTATEEVLGTSYDQLTDAIFDYIYSLV